MNKKEKLIFYIKSIPYHLLAIGETIELRLETWNRKRLIKLANIAHEKFADINTTEEEKSKLIKDIENLKIYKLPNFLWNIDYYIK